MLLISSIRTTGDLISCLPEDMDRKDMVLDIESERAVIASPGINEPGKHFPFLSKSEELKENKI